MKRVFLLSTAAILAAAGTEAAAAGSSPSYDYGTASDPAAAVGQGSRMTRTAGASAAAANTVIGNFDHSSHHPSPGTASDDDIYGSFYDYRRDLGEGGGGAAGTSGAADLYDDSPHHHHHHQQRQLPAGTGGRMGDEHIESSSSAAAAAGGGGGGAGGTASAALTLMEVSEAERDFVEAMRVKARNLKKSGIGSGPAGWGVEQYFTPHKVVSYEKEVAPGNVIVDGYMVDPHTVDGFYFPASTTQYSVAPGSDAALPVMQPRDLATNYRNNNMLLYGGGGGLAGSAGGLSAVAVPLLPNSGIAARLPVPAAPAFPALNYNIPPNTVNVGGVGTIYNRPIRNLRKTPSAGPTGFGVEQHYQPHTVLQYDWRPSYEEYMVLGGPAPRAEALFTPSYRTDGIAGTSRGLESTQYVYYSVNPAGSSTPLPPLTNTAMVGQPLLPPTVIETVLPGSAAPAISPSVYYY